MDRTTERLATSARLGYLVLAGVLVLDVAIPIVGPDANRPMVGSALVIGFLMAQVGVHAVWVSLGSARWHIRGASVLPMLGVLWWSVVGWSGREPFFQIYLAQWCIVVLVFAAMRLAGFRLVQPTAGTNAAPARQYSLRDLVVAVTLTGVIAGVAVRGEWSSRVPETDLVIVMIFAALCAVPTLLSVTATLVARTTFLPTMLAMFAAAALGFAVARWLAGGRQIVPYVTLFAAPTAMQMGLLLWWRWRGWRLRRAPGARAETPGVVVESPAASP